MAEWLRRGLQIPARRFDSGSGLQPPSEILCLCRWGPLSGRLVAKIAIQTSAEHGLVVERLPH